MKKGKKKGGHKKGHKRATKKQLLALAKGQEAMGNRSAARKLRKRAHGRRKNPAGMTAAQHKKLGRGLAKAAKAEAKAAKAAAPKKRKGKGGAKKASAKTTKKTTRKSGGKKKTTRKSSSKKPSTAMTRASAHGPTIHVSQHLLGGPKSSTKRPAFRKVGGASKKVYKSVKGNKKITVSSSYGRKNPHGNYMNVAILAGTLTAGLFVAKIVDALIATRTPAGGQHPWYGRDAELRIQQTPDMMRMAAQAAGAVVGIGAGVYFGRKYPKIAYAATGLGIAFAATLLLDLLWKRGLPKILPVKTGDEMNFTNRVAPETSDPVQARIAALIKADNDAIAANDPAQMPVGQKVNPGDQTKLDASYQYAAADGSQPMTGNQAPIALGGAPNQRDGAAFKGWPKQKQLPSPTRRVSTLGDCGGCGSCDACDAHKQRMQAAAAVVKSIEYAATAAKKDCGCPTPGPVTTPTDSNANRQTSPTPQGPMFTPAPQGPVRTPVLPIRPMGFGMPRRPTGFNFTVAPRATGRGVRA